MLTELMMKIRLFIWQLFFNSIRSRFVSTTFVCLIVLFFLYRISYSSITLLCLIRNFLVIYIIRYNSLDDGRFSFFLSFSSFHCVPNSREHFFFHTHTHWLQHSLSFIVSKSFTYKNMLLQLWLPCLSSSK